jgi:hypothetical protein
MYDTLNEEALAVQRNTQYYRYLKRYEPLMEQLHNDSVLSRARKITKDDVIAVGSMFEEYERQERFIKEQLGTVSDLGQLPRIAYDVILGFYGGSVIPMIASTQSIKSSQGIVYFKDIRASNTRGNVTAGDNLRRSDSVPDVYADGYSHSLVRDEALIATSSPTTQYLPTIANAPVRKGTVVFTLVSDPSAVIKDDSEGNILSTNGISGTIDYETGDVDFNFPADPGSDNVTVTYATQFEADGGYPLMQPVFRNKLVNAQTFVLGQKLGLFQNYEMMQTLGRNAEEDMISDLTNELMVQVATRLIKDYEAKAVGNVNFDAQPGAGVEEYLHRLNLKFKLSAAGNNITATAGRGHGNVWIAGFNGATYIENLPGFELSGVYASGAHYFGTYNKTIPVIKSPEIDTNTILVLYKGEGGFDAPGVHATYMPLTVLRPDDPDNTLQKRGVAAHWAAVDTVVPNFITKVTIQNPQI